MHIYSLMGRLAFSTGRHLPDKTTVKALREIDAGQSSASTTFRNGCDTKRPPLIPGLQKQNRCAGPTEAPDFCCCVWIVREDLADRAAINTGRWSGPSGS